MVSYQALGMDVPVRASGGEVLGTVEHAGGSLHDWFGRTFGRGHWKWDD